METFEEILKILAGIKARNFSYIRWKIGRKVNFHTSLSVGIHSKTKVYLLPGEIYGANAHLSRMQSQSLYTLSKIQ